MSFRIGFRIVDERLQNWVIASLSSSEFAFSLGLDARQYFSNFHSCPVQMVSKIWPSPIVAMQIVVAHMIESWWLSILSLVDVLESFRIVAWMTARGC